LQGIWAYIFKQKGWITLLHYGRLGNLRSVRNTRRSKADTPHLPLPLVAPPPELHHFAKTGIAAGRPAADVFRRGARRSEQRIKSALNAVVESGCCRTQPPSSHRTASTISAPAPACTRVSCERNFPIDSSMTRYLAALDRRRHQHDLRYRPSSFDRAPNPPTPIR
jgi:hypothetical protein